MARIKIPYLNPLNFVDVSPIQVPQYISKHMDDYLKEERLTQWEQQPNGIYQQPFLKSDVISTQLQSDAGLPTFKIIDCRMKTWDTYPMTQRQQNQYDPGYFIWESQSALTALPENYYFAVIENGAPTVVKTMISQGFKVQTEQPGTVLFEYTNRRYYGEFVFETGITPSIRLNAILRYKLPASKDTVFEDQILDMVMIKSQPYRLWELVIINVPDWMIDKLNWIIGCSELRLDGKYFSKNEGAKLEPTNVLGNGYTTEYKLELRELLTRGSKIFDTTNDTDEELSIMLNSTSKGFADTSEEGSSSIVTFLDVE